MLFVREPRARPPSRSRARLPHPERARGAARELPDAQITLARGCDVEDLDTSGFAAAVETAADADVAIVVVGDRAGLFGRGTVGEGNDVESLELPGCSAELVEAVVATGTPVVVVLLTGRPYAIGWALERPPRRRQ